MIIDRVWARYAPSSQRHALATLYNMGTHEPPRHISCSALETIRDVACTDTRYRLYVAIDTTSWVKAALWARWSEQGQSRSGRTNQECLGTSGRRWQPSRDERSGPSTTSSQGSVSRFLERDRLG